jgi:hypothetical protein
MLGPLKAMGRTINKFDYSASLIDSFCSPYNLRSPACSAINVLPRARVR